MIFKIRSIRQKFIILSGVVLLSFVISWIITYPKLKSVHNSWISYQDEVAKRQDLLMTIKSNFGYGGGIHNFKNYVLRGNQKYADRFVENHRVITESIKQYRSLVDLSVNEKDGLTAIQEIADKYKEAVFTAQKMHRENKSSNEIDRIVKIDDSPAFKAFDTISSRYQEMTSLATAELASSIRGTMVVMAVVSLVAFIIISSVAVIIGVTITRHVKKFTYMLRDIANGEGDLTMRLECGDDESEIGEMAGWFNMFLDNMQAVVYKVISATQNIVSTSEKLTFTSSAITEKADDHAAQSERVATAMNEMAATVIEVASNTQSAAELAKSSQDVASKGGAVVEAAVSGIEELTHLVEKTAKEVEVLGENSEHIGEIIAVIDEIADQTELLALNAAIEAARAGEEGRGFAVVADEVRNLAEKTTRATAQIRERISKVQEETSKVIESMERGAKMSGEGIDLVREAGGAFNEITQNVDWVTEMIQQIATATEEQSATTEEISNNMDGMASITSETAGKMKENSQVIEVLNNTAEELKKLVDGFKI